MTRRTDGCPSVSVPVRAHLTIEAHYFTGEWLPFNQLVARYRIVFEHVNAQLNRYQVLQQVLRSVWRRHTRVIRVVAMIVDRRIRVVPLKTYAA